MASSADTCRRHLRGNLLTLRLSGRGLYSLISYLGQTRGDLSGAWIQDALTVSESGGRSRRMSLGSALMLLILTLCALFQILRFVVDEDSRDHDRLCRFNRASSRYTYCHARASIRDEEHRSIIMPNWRCVSKSFYLTLSRGEHASLPFRTFPAATGPTTSSVQ